MFKQECIAMILAGGQGSRLAALTTQIPKPAIPFGGSCRLIDFSLSNCYNSGIDTVGVLTAKQSSELSKQIGSLIAQSLPRDRENAHILAHTGMNGLSSYTGTANAIYENINFIEQFHPEYVLILSGDHVYKMDYSLLLEYHKERGADATISAIEVPWLDAPRFGIIGTRPDNYVVEFAEKPIQPKSNLASMGVYLFSWPKLKKYLEMDEANAISSHDFGKNIIPAMLRQEEKIYAYPFTGYWKDVGTIESLYQANMDLLSSPPIFDIHDKKWPIYSTLTDLPLPVLVATRKSRSLISENCSIYGKIEQSVVFPAVFIGNNTKVKNSVIMPGAYVGHGAYVENAIIGPGAAVKNGHVVFGGVSPNIAVIAQNSVTSSMQIEFGHYPSNQKKPIWEIFKDDVLY